jgi:hypothetical protein
MLAWPTAHPYADTNDMGGRKPVSQNRLTVVLALSVLAIIVVGWMVQLGGGYKAGSPGRGPYGESPQTGPKGPQY